MRLNLLFVFLLIALAGMGQTAPDLDKALSTAKAQYPQVDSMDVIMSRLRYFDSIPPITEQLNKLIEIYKAVSAGYATNFHYRQGYGVYEKYLLLKQNKLWDEKQAALKMMNDKFKKMDAADGEKVTTLRSKVDDISDDAEMLDTQGSVFKKLLTGAIIVISLLFAFSLFRTGIRLREINSLVAGHREKLNANHRMATLGMLSQGLRETVEKNYHTNTEIAKDLLDSLPDSEANTPLKEKLEKIKDI